MLGRKPQDPSLTVSELKEDHKPQIIFWREDGKVVDLYLKYKEEESNNDEFQEAAPAEISGDEEKSDKRNIDKELRILIKEEIDIKNETGEELTPKPGSQSVLPQCSECLYKITHNCTLKSPSKHKKTDEIDWYSCPEYPYKACRKVDLNRHDQIDNSKNLTLKYSKCSYKEHQTNVHGLHCSECAFKTHQSSRIKTHILACQSNSFKCSKCSYQSKTKQQLTIHQLKHEGMDKWHTCQLCPYKTCYKRGLKRHCLSFHSSDSNDHKKTKIFKCSECPYRSERNDVMKGHQLIHDRSSWFQCSDCGYKTARKSNLNIHQLRHQGENAEVWLRCTECSYKTVRKSNLISHALSHKAADQLRRFECSKCSFKTTLKYSLRRHQLTHRESQEIEWFSCYECSFKTKRKSYLVTHIMSTHKNHIFKCVDCSYESRTKSQLTIHLVKHESVDKWHSCPLCPYKNYNKKFLKEHCRQRHSCDPKDPQQIEIFKCTECSFENGSKDSVKRHELIHDRRNWFQCPDCAYKTPYKSLFKKHQLRHQGENAKGWHECPECSYKTAFISNLRRHVLSHKTDNIQQFQCSQCSFKTAYKESLRRHSLNHKKGNEWFCCYECSFKTKYKTQLVRHISLKHQKRQRERLLTK